MGNHHDNDDDSDDDGHDDNNDHESHDGNGDDGNDLGQYVSRSREGGMPLPRSSTFTCSDEVVVCTRLLCTLLFPTFLIIASQAPTNLPQPSTSSAPPAAFWSSVVALLGCPSSQIKSRVGGLVTWVKCRNSILSSQ